MLKDFINAVGGGICGVMDKRYVNNDNKTIWYIDANNVYGYAIVQKLPCKDFSSTDII